MGGIVFESGVRIVDHNVGGFFFYGGKKIGILFSFKTGYGIVSRRVLSLCPPIT